jgi:hypothetical protein
VLAQVSAREKAQVSARVKELESARASVLVLEQASVLVLVQPDLALAQVQVSAEQDLESVLQVLDPEWVQGLESELGLPRAQEQE